MPQITDSRDVYRQLVEESDEDWLYGLLAFAVIEEERMEWMEHFEQTRGAAPSAEDIANWYRQQPESVLLKAKNRAERALVAYASESAETALVAEGRKILEDAVIAEVRESRRFWSQFGPSFVAGLTSTLLVALVLVILTFVVWTDPSPVSIIRNQIENSVGQ